MGEKVRVQGDHPLERYCPRCGSSNSHVTGGIYTDYEMGGDNLTERACLDCGCQFYQRIASPDYDPTPIFVRRALTFREAMAKLAERPDLVLVRGPYVLQSRSSFGFVLKDSRGIVVEAGQNLPENLISHRQQTPSSCREENETGGNWPETIPPILVAGLPTENQDKQPPGKNNLSPRAASADFETSTYAQQVLDEQYGHPTAVEWEAISAEEQKDYQFWRKEAEEQEYRLEKVLELGVEGAAEQFRRDELYKIEKERELRAKQAREQTEKLAKRREIYKHHENMRWDDE
jgi:transposase-like protein